MNNNVLKPFISTHLPEFIVSDNPTFKAFIEAYYEFLEKRNDSESINVKELFKSVHNPAGIVNNITATKDIDETLDQFIRYFKKEVLPFAIETSAVKDRFLVKKIRDVYLSKGSPKSFELYSECCIMKKLISSKHVTILWNYQKESFFRFL